MSLVGKRVKVPSVKLFKDAEGKAVTYTIVGGIYKCDQHIPYKSCPVHIINEKGESGWVRCYPTGTVLRNIPPIHVLKSDELYIN